MKPGAPLSTLLVVMAMLGPRALQAEPFAYVTNLGAASVSVVDTGPSPPIVTATISVAGFPRGVAITPDGSRAYISHFSFQNRVTVIDTLTNTVTATVMVGSSPIGVAVSPDGTRAYVANFSSDSISIIDTGTNSVAKTVPVGFSPFGVAITPDGGRAYVSNLDSDSVSIIDTATESVIGSPIPVGPFPAGLAVSPDGTRVYVVNFTSSSPVVNASVSVIDTATNTVMATVIIGSGPQEVAFSPDGTRAYTTDLFSNAVSVIDTTAIPPTVVATVPTSGPRGVKVTPDGTRVFVTNEFPGSVTAVDAASESVVAAVTTGSQAYSVAITPTDSDPAAQLQDVAEEIQASIDANPDTSLGDKLEDALGKLGITLIELNKTPPDNQAAMGNIEGAVGDLEAAIGLDPAQDVAITDLMDQLTGTARQLASDAIEAATAGGGDPGKIDDTLQALAEGDALRSEGAFKDAVIKYKDALAKAEGA